MEAVRGITNFKSRASHRRAKIENGVVVVGISNQARSADCNILIKLRNTVTLSVHYIVFTVRVTSPWRKAFGREDPVDDMTMTFGKGGKGRVIR